MRKVYSTILWAMCGFIAFGALGGLLQGAVIPGLITLMVAGLCGWGARRLWQSPSTRGTSGAPTTAPSPPLPERNGVNAPPATVRLGALGGVPAPDSTAPKAHTKKVSERVAARAHSGKPVQMRAIRRAELTRSTTRYPARTQTFAAIDLETTGLEPSTGGIVEIGVVKFSGDGTVIDEFATLVNTPGSSRDARDVHGIEDADLHDAPTLAQLWPELTAFIAGSILVSHNLDFEEKFLLAAARQVGTPLPDVPGICTLADSRRHLEGRAFSLKAMHKTATGGWRDGEHTALGDARAVKDVLMWLIKESPKPMHVTAVADSYVGPIPASTPIRCRPVPLRQASVIELLTSYPVSARAREGDPASIQAYRDCLAESMSDGFLTYDEANELCILARQTGLTGSQLRHLHQTAWESTFGADATADFVALSPTRRREMTLAAKGLGLSDTQQLLEDSSNAVEEPPTSPQSRFLKGLRVGILGTTPAITELRTKAVEYGAKPAARITKTVQWVATDQVDTLDVHHEAARALGIPLLSATDARVRLDSAIRQAEMDMLERQRSIDEWAAQREARERENEAYWRPTWRRKELAQDPGPDFGDDEDW